MLLLLNSNPNPSVTDATTVEDIHGSFQCRFLCKWSTSPGPGCRRCWKVRCSCPSALIWLPASAHHAAAWASGGQPNNTHGITFHCAPSLLTCEHDEDQCKCWAEEICVSNLYPWHLVSAHPSIDITWLIQPCQPRLPASWKHICKHGYNPS